MPVAQKNGNHRRREADALSFVGAGRHWVQVHHEGQKVAEVEFEVTP